MMQFLYLSGFAQVVFAVFLLATLILQTLVISQDIYLHNYHPAFLPRLLLDISFLVLLCGPVLSLYAAVQQFVPGQGVWLDEFFWRSVFCLLHAGVSLAYLFRQKEAAVLIHPLLALLASPLTDRLPDGISFPAYICLYGLSMFCSLRQIMYSRRLRHSTITGFSVYEAVSAMHEGVCFCDESGNILLVNTEMYRLMRRLLRQIYTDGRQFYHDLQQQYFPSGDPLVTLADGTTWMFSRTPVSDGRNVYTQITAADVTRQMEAAFSLSRTRRQLEATSAELKKHLETLMEDSHEEVLHETRMRTHDLLGSRLSLLLQSLRYESASLDLHVLETACDDLMEEIAGSGTNISAAQEMDRLEAVFEQLGIEIERTGPLPEGKTGRVLVDIFREAVTNAVRHGSATRITAVTEEDEDTLIFTIRDNGTGAAVYHEGSGIRGMRRKAAEAGGALEITTQPGFVITIRLPRERSTL